MDGLQGKRVLITAGAAGIGRVMAENFKARGARVAVCDADEAACAEMAAANPDILTRVVNVTEPAQVDRFFDEALETLGGLDVAAANAGIGGPAAPVEEMPFEGWKDTLAVNLDGAFLVARRAAPVFKAQRSGLLLLTSSTSGLFGHPYRSPYAAAKWGIIGLTKTWAMELGPYNILVNSVCPGYVNTDMTKQNVPEEQQKEIKQRIPLRRFAEPDEIAKLISFLISEDKDKVEVFQP